MKPQQMILRSFIINQQHQRIALFGRIWKENLDGVVAITPHLKKLQLRMSGTLEQSEFCGCFRERNVAVTFLAEKFPYHVVSVGQSGTCKGADIHQAVALTTHVIRTRCRELLSHWHMRLCGCFVRWCDNCGFAPGLFKTIFIVFHAAVVWAKVCF